MNYSDKTPSQILSDAAHQLEIGSWSQGGFFQLKNDQVCMCAHGAIRYCGSKEIKDLIDLKNILAASRPAESAAGITAVATPTHAPSAMIYWDIYYQQYYPQCRNLFLAHHYAWRVGLSYDFNDAKNRTKEEVITKLYEAAELAQSENN